MESENSAFPQVDRLRPNVLRSLRVHQQDDGNHSRSVGGTSHYFRQGHGEHQRPQSTPKRRIQEKKDLGKLKSILSIPVHRGKERKIIHLSQPGYIRTILRGNYDDRQPARQTLVHLSARINEKNSR